jgi:hypothetical protein
MDNLTTNERIKLAITEIESQAQPNYTATAEKWRIDRSTLSRRHRGVTGTRQQAISTSCKLLTDAQESILVEYINKLNARGLPPTPQIVKNLAEELSDKKVGHNWTSNFIARKRTELRSMYLPTIDHKRKISDNSHHYEHFFSEVSIFLYYVGLYIRILLILSLPLDLAAKNNRKVPHFASKHVEF